jgi:hypothetical protein
MMGVMGVVLKEGDCCIRYTPDFSKYGFYLCKKLNDIHIICKIDILTRNFFLIVNSFLSLKHGVIHEVL